jgi:hypothetical protein
MPSVSAPHIALLVTGAEALADFVIFVKTLEVWHPDATLYVLTDSVTNLGGIRFKGTIHTRVALDGYRGLNRKAMEGMPGRIYDTLFKDYTYEKAGVIEWAFEMTPELAGSGKGLWFMDSDITHLAPLPTLPEDSVIALSPHYIRESDCRLYGRYNAGYFWLRDTSLIGAWRSAGFTSRFFEQAALEDVAVGAGSGLYEFPIQVNFGWWRMFQGLIPPAEVQSKFSFNRADVSVGLRYNGAVVQSIHTHWFDNSSSATGVFNGWINEYTRKFASHKPMAGFRRSLGFR